MGDSSGTDSPGASTSFGFSIFDKIVSVIRTCAQGGTAIVALCFIIGLVIQNVYLSQFGVFQLSLLEVPRYVMVGGLGLSNWSCSLHPLLQPYLRSSFLINRLRANQQAPTP